MMSTIYEIKHFVQCIIYVHVYLFKCIIVKKNTPKDNSINKTRDASLNFCEHRSVACFRDEKKI